MGLTDVCGKRALSHKKEKGYQGLKNTLYLRPVGKVHPSLEAKGRGVQ